MPRPGTFIIEVNKGILEQVQRELAEMPEKIQPLLVAAINRTLSTGKTRIVRRLRKESGIRRNVIAERISTRKAKKVRGALPFGRIIIRPRRIPLIEFVTERSLRAWASGAAQQRRALVEVKLPRREREDVPAAFIHKGRGGPQVLQRQHKGTGFVPRYPLFIRFGPSLVEMFENLAGLQEEELNGIGEVLDKNILSQLDRVLQRSKADRPLLA